MRNNIEMAVVSSNEDDSLTLHLTTTQGRKEMTIRKSAAASLVGRIVKEMAGVDSKGNG